MTKRFAVIGDPIAHSRSPVMHEAAYRALGIDATYERVRVRPDELAAFIAGAEAEGYQGLNVTLPHKSAVIALIHEVTPTAARIGAVNTITIRGGALYGDNTDARGLVRSLEDAGFGAEGARVVVLGAGGAARAAVVGLSEAGAAEILVAARRPSAASKLAEALATDAPAPITGHGFDDLERVFAGADLLVQATSATLAGSDASSDVAIRFADGLPWDALAPSATVTDLVYQPLETTVLRAARARGHRAIDGLGMLIHQGALAFEGWLGVAAPVAVMRAALL
ncbi:MAG: shikimate dehydrogenase [Deltaproteobacteria bacterium]|nr:MAG: shikimate dehydrogenase [Deltaproteobacteria bacterium]